MSESQFHSQIPQFQNFQNFLGYSENDRFKRESSYLRHLLRFGSSQFHLPSIDPLYRRQATLPLGNFPYDSVLACVMGMVMRTVRRENVVATHDIVNHRVTPTA